MTEVNRRRSRWTRFSYVPLLIALAGACSDSKDSAREPSAQVVAARDLAAEYGAIGNLWTEAQETLLPIAQADDAAAEDLLRLVFAYLTKDKVDQALPFLERAGALLPTDSAELAWARFRVARIRVENEEAAKQLELLHRLRPGDVTVSLALASVLQSLDKADRAKALYREVLALPAEETLPWRVFGVFRYASLLTQLGEDASAFYAEYDGFVKAGNDSPGEPAHQAGTLGSLRPHTPEALQLPTPAPPAIKFTSLEITLPATSLGMRSLSLTRGTILPRSSRNSEEIFDWTTPGPAVASFGPEGLLLHESKDGEKWQTRKLWDQPLWDAIAFDRMNHGAQPKSEKADEPKDEFMDLILVAQDGLYLMELTDQGWSDAPTKIIDLEGQPGMNQLLAVDFDHDGDLDLFSTRGKQTRLLRNDGFDSNPSLFTDVGGEVDFPRGSFTPLIEDLDLDSDVDLLLVDSESAQPQLFSSLRGGRFENLSRDLPRADNADYALFADFDGDARPDLAFVGQGVKLHLQNASGGWSQEPLVWATNAAPSGRPLVLDWDMDGALDLLWPSADHFATGLLAPGHAQGGVAFDAGPAAEGQAQLIALDVDGDRDLDLLRLDASGLKLQRSEDGPKGIPFAVTGHKDNVVGIGSVVEARTGMRYTRLFWDGQPKLIGTAGKASLDLLRVSWPNGVVQNELGLPLAGAYLYWQRRGLAGSCPFVYTWNGKTFEYISDVLGITPLGLPMAPGMMVPPDHDEFVLVKGDKLVPRDGFYEMQFTEELREVTYLDRLRLEVVDHPLGTEIFPNERFSFPPFPEEHTHSVRDALAPLKAVDGEGHDWTTELARDDELLAIPFQPIRGQFQGLATPHTIELSFDREAMLGAKKLRLLMNGWLYWTDASVNMAAARHPDYEFVPPTLQVPDGQGGWRDTGPPVGFPAGKLKTMVLDITHLINRDDPRIRLFSTLRLYWDSLRLAVDDDDAPLRVTHLDPSSARLWDRGFSLPIVTHGAHELDWFEWDRLEPQPRWNQHPGLYTKLGETLPLVGAIDDRFVVMGAGDALHVRFDASQVPPLEKGWTRDFIIFLDGWAKDRDPNTLEALYVEPLPFHGMSGYPYPPEESFPDSAAHREWKRTWQTREAKRWIQPVVPERQPTAAKDLN